jgi:sphingomyelin phosphodiesterase acid-like 3
VLNKSNADRVLRDFPALGDYVVDLPKPFEHTKLLSMQDIFESKRYESCDGKDSLKEGKEQIDWLKGELDRARANHDRVWVLAHIPPGIDAYSTFTKSDSGGSCRFSQPAEFLNSELFADTLGDYTDVITLVLLGHTHMDEMRVFTANKGEGAIPGKLTPSISPVDGNNPSFTVGTVDPERATLVDWSVYAASNQTGIDAAWSLEYTYSKTFHRPDYSAAAALSLTRDFLADRQSRTAASQAYESHYFVGGPSAGLNLKAAALGLVWPIYTCSLVHDHVTSFVDCACPKN